MTLNVGAWQIMTERAPFQTGSQVYGTPRGDSDFDVVVYLPSPLKDLLMELIGEEHEFKSYPRIGRLQLILVDDPEEYDAWKLCTEYAIDKAKTHGPLSKENSRRIFNDYFTEAGLEDGNDYLMEAGLEDAITNWKQHQGETRNNNG